LTVLLPFAAGYYLSYLFRTVNALSSSRLSVDLHLGASELGLLTAAYFLAFAAAQLPVGVALDHFGPRRVQLVLLPLAAAGAAVFAAADGFALLLLGRALLGLGFAAALMGGLKALVLWFPAERLALANGCFVMLGALGAVTATAPAEVLLDSFGWRGLFWALAALTVLSAALLWFAAPREQVASRPPRMSGPSLRQVFCHRGFWRLAPISACCIGTSFALQGLWAVPWLTDVALLDRPSVVRALLAMALGLCAGALLLGIVADRLRRAGVRPCDLLVAVAGAAMLAQLALVLRVPVAPEPIWIFLGAVGSATVLSYAGLSEVFPRELAGRANAALTLLHTGAAFLVQAGIGCVVGLWPADADGRYPVDAYAAAFGANLVPQVLAVVWFLRAPRPLDTGSDVALAVSDR
jgi:predicted MFS family arabinose efflux permease